MKIKINTLKKITAVSFITLFAVFILVPNTGLPRTDENTNLVKQRENRQIAALPTANFPKKDFFNQFDNWYQDRLRYKYKLISAWRKFNYLSLGISVDKDMFIGKNDWFFSRNQCLNKFVEPNKKVSYLKTLQTYCNKNGKPFIFMLPPKNESVYRDYFPEEIRKQYKEPEFYQNQAELLLKTNNINYLPINNELQQQRKTETHDLYFKDDFHWSYYAAVTASDLLLKKLNVDLNKNFYKGLKLDGSTKEAYKPCGHSGYFGLPKYHDVTAAPWSKSYTDEIYLTDCYTGETQKFTKVFSQDSLWETTCKGEAIITNKKSDNNIKLLILCDSYTTYMASYISQNVKQLILTNYDVCTGKKEDVNITKLINKYKPDAIALIMLETGFFHNKADYVFRYLKY